MEFQLLEISGDNVVTPTDYARMISPYSDILDRDSSERQDLALRELAYITFMVDPRQKNVFYGYNLESGERAAKIIENKFKDYPNWQPDELIRVGIEQWKEFFYKASPSLRHLESNIIAMDKLSNHYRTFDMDERNIKTNMPIYKPKEVSDGIKNSKSMITEIEALKKMIEEELYTAGKTKRDKPVNHFER